MQKMQTIKNGTRDNNQDLADTFDEMYDSDDLDLNEREDMMNSKTQPSMRSYISRIEQKNNLQA